MRTLITAPASEPVTLQELKDFLRIVRSNDDSFLTALITAARDIVEKVQWRQLIDAVWDITLKEFPTDGIIWLPFPPLDSVTHVKYYDTSNTQQTLSTSYYTVHTSTEDPGYIQLASGYTWPTVEDRVDPIVVRIVAGYGTAASAVPEATKAAIKILASEFYLNRTATSGGEMGTVTAPQWSNAAEALMQINACRQRTVNDLA